MKATYRIEDPSQVECTLSVTMRVDEWRSLLLKVNENSWPANVLGTAIRKLIADANQAFDTTGEYQP